MVSATIHVRLDQSTQTRLKEAAAAHDRSVAYWAARLIEDGLDRPENPAEPPRKPAPVLAAPEIAGELPPPAMRKHGGAPNYERLCRVLKYTLALHGAVDALGRRGVDEKKARDAFTEARIRENETDNKGAHSAAWHENLRRLLAEGVVECDGSIIRPLQQL
jgi:hypothetical protein